MRLSLVMVAPSSDPLDVVRRRRFSSMIRSKMTDRGRLAGRPVTLTVQLTVGLSGLKIIPHVMPLRTIAPVIKFVPCDHDRHRRRTTLAISLILVSHSQHAHGY